MSSKDSLCETGAPGSDTEEAMSDTTVAQETEKIARRMARDTGEPEGLWELFLMDAYREYYKLDQVAP